MRRVTLAIQSMLTISLACLAFILFARPEAATAQEVLKHPRVVELEDRLNKDAAAYIKSRFPDVPFMVSVRVDPLRRDSRMRPADGTDTDLPFFQSGDSEDEIKDEWDNTQVPLMALLNRVRRIEVRISVPEKLKEVEVSELKEGILNILHLTPARDGVEVSRRDWVTDEVPWVAVYVAGTAIFMLLIGLLVINRTSANRIAKALTDMKLQGSNGASGGALAGPIASPDSGLSSQSKRLQSQELKFNDPIKIKELAGKLIETLTSSDHFPNHLDMYVLDEVGRESNQNLGAILTQFKSEIQGTLLEYSPDFHWVAAINDPGFLDFDCLEVLQSMVQHNRGEKSSAWSCMILAVWRLGEHRTHFIRTLPKDDAFAILAELPKSIGVAEARKIFPGSWAAIIDPNTKYKRLTEARISEIHASAIGVVPLFNLAMVKAYRADKELLDYVKVVDPAEERDIYGAAPETSLIHRVRPPFFVVFDQSPEILKSLIPRISTEHWSLALFNVLKTERSVIDQHLSEKQRFLMIERFKRYDVQPPSAEQVGNAREFIGATLKKVTIELSNTEKATSEDDKGILPSETKAAA